MGNAVTYGQILWDNFFQYIPKKSPREDGNELTFALFWLLCILNLHKDSKLDMGDDTTLFATCDLKRYSFWTS